jgi:Fe-S cluster assembly protein SufD
MNTTTNLSLAEKIQTDYELVKELDVALGGMREKAYERFKTIGIPSKRHEEYKYTPFDRLLHDAYQQQLFPDLSIDSASLNALLKHNHYDDAVRIIFINGVINVELSDIDKLDAAVSIKPFLEYPSAHAIVANSAVNDSKDPFVLMNTTFANHRICIEIAPKVELKNPIQLIFISNCQEQLITYNKLAVVVNKSAKVDFIETHLSLNTVEAFVNHFLEFFIAEQATVNHLLVQDIQKNQLLVNNTFIHIARHSKFHTNTFSFTGKVIRNNLSIALDAPECEAHLYGFYHPSAGELIDNHTLVDHRMPHCQSNELYKGVIENEGTAVFNGKVYVRPDAQKTNAYQSNKNILMGESSVVNTKPQLEIYADDVKCSHGSSTGFIDDEAMFYLRSRGIGQEKAKTLLLHAFAGEILENLPIASAKRNIEARLEQLFQ